MSEPIANENVEDVLASIRRLVSEEKRPVRAAPVEAATPKQRSHLESDRLVLTPSLRVAAPLEPMGRVDIDPEAKEDPKPALAENPAPETEDEPELVTASLEDAGEAELTGDVAEPATQPEPALKEAELSQEEQNAAELAAWLLKKSKAIDTVARQPDEVLKDRDRSDDPASSESGALLLDDTARNWSTEGIDADSPVEPGAHVPEAVDASVPDEPSEVASANSIAADADVQADMFNDPDDVSDATSRDEIAHETDAQPVENEAEQSAKQEVEAGTTASPAPDDLGAKIAALEAMIGRREDNWEPDGVDVDAYSGTDAPTMAWEDHVSDVTEAVAEVVIEEVAQVSAEQESASVDPEPELQDTVEEDVLPLSNDPELIDEEALRDLVSEIVRQELQGALGERITRNVRKLVRREIHRALATRELD